ncbi:MAG: lycopene cyclase domain-containing protein [Melioribacteraceae bacterium]|nr:lycopene cyclase domain-containing protein [Melioribacteraceae bacterium]
MSIYLLINILTIIIPLIMSFEKKIKFYKNYSHLFLSISLVGFVFIIWDIIATIRNDWSFNTKYILGIKFFHLPLEEILFFVTVPFASIFLYETAKSYLPESKINFPRNLSIIISLIAVTISIVYYKQYYTFTVMIFVSIFFLINYFTKNYLLSSNIYWIWILFTYLPFFVVNYILTSLPIVSYSSNAIWNIRIITIPLEDFFYSFSLLSFNLFFYKLFKEKCPRKK